MIFAANRLRNISGHFATCSLLASGIALRYDGTRSSYGDDRCAILR